MGTNHKRTASWTYTSSETQTKLAWRPANDKPFKPPLHIRTNRSLHNQVHLKKFPAKYRLGPTLIRKQTDHQQKEKTEINKMQVE